MVSSFIFHNISGEELTEPPPQTPPPFFSGLALGSGFALNSQALCAFKMGFVLNSRAIRAIDSGFTLNFRLGILVPPSKFLDPPVSTVNCNGDVKCFASDGQAPI